MACKQCIPAIISGKAPSLRGHVRARSLAAALTLGAGVALSAVTAAVSSATAQELEWATSAGGVSPHGRSDVGFDIAMDPRGNSYVTGNFQGTATFGAGEPNETVLEASSGRGIFLAKYARDGALVWATSTDSTIGLPSRVATDARGNSYVTGSVDGTTTFGVGEPNETVLEHHGTFVAKYASEGTLLWATSAGGSGEGIAAMPRGNIYITGDFEGTATFGAGQANETVLEASGLSDVFVAKYGSSNDQDQCPDPDLSATVVLDGNDTGVDNVLTNTEGCTILDLILQASDKAADRTDFIRGVALLTGRS